MASAPITLVGPIEPIARYQDTGHEVFQLNGPIKNPLARYAFSVLRACLFYKAHRLIKFLCGECAKLSEALNFCWIPWIDSEP